MTCLTEQEFRELLGRLRPSISFDERLYPFFTDREADCFAINISTNGYSLPYLARVLGLAEVEEETYFGGAFLSYGLWDIGSPQLDKIGWAVVERMRLGYGEMRPLETAPIHRFREDEATQLQAFLLQAMVFQWDANLIFPTFDRFVHVSHHRSVVVAGKTKAIRDECWSALDSLGPAPATDQVRSLFLRPDTSRAGADLLRIRLKTQGSE